jgi:hypothetical protein
MEYLPICPHFRQDSAGLLQIKLGFELGGKLLDRLTTTGIFCWSFLCNHSYPTVAIRLNGNHHVGRPVADILHFHLDKVPLVLVRTRLPASQSRNDYHRSIAALAR